MALIEGIEDRGAGEIATRVRAVFCRAVALGYREVNPAGELHNHLKPRKKGQQTALAANELPTFLHALETYQGDAATRLGLRLLILTLARTSEVREVKWAEFDREEGVWTVPGERMKNRREHRVPLTQ
ncbi:MAG: tyrosine-type recombinase/integrase, partial [Pseudomonadota bacterium]|nr:tyrosine-type recombinase/integrase [Pseudomonadota bacterium]